MIAIPKIKIKEINAKRKLLLKYNFPFKISASGFEIKPDMKVGIANSPNPK